MHNLRWMIRAFAKDKSHTHTIDGGDSFTEMREIKQAIPVIYLNSRRSQSEYLFARNFTN